MGFAALLATPLVRKIGIGLIVVASLAAYLSYTMHRAREAGKEEGRQSAAQDLKADAENLRQQAKEEFAARMKELSDQIDQYKRDQEADQEREIQTLQTLAAISRQKTAAAGNLAKTPDAELHGKIMAALGRPPGDLAPGYSAVEEREIAQCLLVDRPTCKAESAARSDQAQELGGQVAAMSKQLDALDEKFAALGAYATRVEQSYVEIYNAFPKKGNRLIALLTRGRWGRPNKLPFPDPQELLGKKEKK